MTANSQTQKTFFSKVSHFSHFPKISTYNLKPKSPLVEKTESGESGESTELGEPDKLGEPAQLANSPESISCFSFMHYALHRGVSPNYALCIMNSALINYQMMVRSFSSSHILAPGLMSNALKKVSMLRRVAFTRYSPSECGSLLVCM